MKKQFSIFKNNATKLAIVMLLFFAAGMQQVSAQGFINWGTPSGTPKQMVGTYTGGTVTVTQVNNSLSEKLGFVVPAVVNTSNLGGASSNQTFSTRGKGTTKTKSLLFTFSSKVIINELNIADIDLFSSAWNDAFVFSSNFTTVSATNCSASVGGAIPTISNLGDNLEYARWLTSTPVTTFQIDFSGDGTLFDAYIAYSMKVTLAPCSIALETVGTDAQTVTVGTNITPISYTTNATAPTISPALPAGLTASLSGGVYTIVGTPTAASTYNYTVTFTGGGCPSSTATGTITVNAAVACSSTLSSAAGTNTQTVTAGTAITPISYTTNATEPTISPALPTGLTASLSGGVYTISGTTASTYAYTVTFTGGGCTPNSTATGTITVNAAVACSSTLSSAAGTNTQTVTAGTAITPISYTTNATEPTISPALPTGLTASLSGGVYTISGTTASTYAYTVAFTGGGCTPSSTATGTITVNAAPCPAGTVAPNVF